MLVVEIKNGKLRGQLQTSSFSGIKYYTFMGIPYAEPPVKSLKFRPPVKKTPWNGIWNATRNRDPCVQFCLRRHKLIGSEDCLYLNVNIPEHFSLEDPPKPVVVLIHAGGHSWGSASHDDFGFPDFVMHHDIIYVTFNYRLDILGFLNLNIPECAGNMGLKDIIMSFEWIKENIHAFNGNPNNITVVGSSSGASVLHLFMHIPSTKDLFHKVILMGDIIFNSFVEYTNDNVELAFEFGRALGFKGDSPRKLYAFFKKEDPFKLTTAMRTIYYYRIRSNAKLYPSAAFMPSVEKCGENRLITECPRNLIGTLRPIPTMMGFCEFEPIFGFIDHRKTTTIENFPQTFIQNHWGWMKKANCDHRLIVNEILDYYLPNEDDRNNAVSLCAICTDEVYFNSYDTVMDIVGKHLPTSTYVYKFVYVGELSQVHNEVLPLIKEDIKGSLHFDDFWYWCCPDVKTNRGSVAFQMVETLTKLFTNFARTGNPNGEDQEVIWEPHNFNNPCHLRIGKQLQLVEERLISEKNLRFWESLKKKYVPDEP